MRKPSRRAVLGLLGGGAAALAGARLATPWFLRARPVRSLDELSAAARALVDRAFEGVDRKLLWDSHVHLVGLGAGGTGSTVNPAMQSHLHPFKRLQYDVYMAAAGVRDSERADQEYVERLLALHRAANPEGKLLLFAFDRHVNEDGSEDAAHSTFHTPDRYAHAVAAAHPEAEFCASIHPYRKDALARLDDAAERGARAIKWLPNAMGMDPASPLCDAFYRRLAELGLPLITHAGKEAAVDAHEDQELGNPLRLRRPLDAGVTVVVAHCASTGRSRDLDAEAEEAEMESFDLFMRLFTDERYTENLYGEISTLTQVNRCGRPLAEMLAAVELHPRLVNGSDYPLPAIDPLYSPRLLERKGYLDEGERGALDEIFRANPLLFDFVLKRSVRVERDGGRRRFAPVVFERRERRVLG